MDYTIEDFFKYKQYLNTIDKVLQGYFEDQKEYIFCKKGCSKCCEEGQYPCTELEFKYMMLGFFKLPFEEQQRIAIRIKALRKDYENCLDKKEFKYRCPFLDEKGFCPVYEYRGIICRTFGLITLSDDGNECTIPFCYEYGLNYSNVYNSASKKIDMDKVKELGLNNIPYPRRTNLKTIMSPDFFEGEPLDFGKRKQLVEWL